MPSIVGVSQLIGQRGEQGEPGEPGRPLRVLGSVANIGLLPPDAEFPGDAYVVDGYIYVWDGADWVETFIEAGSAAAGETTGEAVAGIALSDGAGGAVETWLGTTANGGPTAYAITKLEDAGIGGAVASVNGQTGAVVLDAADVGALADTATADDLGALALTDPRAGIITLESEWVSHATHPRVVKPLDAPILTFAAQSAPTLYWPMFVDRRPMGKPGLSLLYSTDHSGGAGGIYSITSEDGPLGTWADDGLIYQDTTLGSQTETPSAMWVPEAGLYYLYYHNVGVPSGSQQRTILATSPDLETFTRVGVVLSHADANHTGYFRPYRDGAEWWGRSLFTSSPTSTNRVWSSPDGLTWTAQGTPVIDESKIDHLTGFVSGQWSARVFYGCMIRWRDELWWVGVVGANLAFNPMGAGRICAGKIDEADRWSFVEDVIDITPTAQAWEGVGISHVGAPIVWGGHVYLPYKAGSDGSTNAAFGLMELI